jgi:hypothetical protein
MRTCLLGEVRILRPPGTALRTVLTGRDAAGIPTEVELCGTNCAGLPEVLPDVSVEVGASGVRIVAPEGESAYRARSVHVHHDLSTVMRAAIPPRPAPLGRRLLFGLLLRLAGHPLTRRLLRAPRATR